MDSPCKNGQKKQKGSKIGSKSKNDKPKPSRSVSFNLEYIDAERLSGLRKRDAEEPYGDIIDNPGPEAVCNYFSNDCQATDDCVIIHEDVTKTEHTVCEPVHVDRISHLNTDEDEDFELQAMFYLPRWSSASPPSSAKLQPGREASLKVILANMAELLSRSPPPLTEEVEADVTVPSPPPSPELPPQPFQISFTLDVDDNDDEGEMLACDADSASLRADLDEPLVRKETSRIHQDWPHLRGQQNGTVAAESPTWDELFGEEMNTNQDDGKEAGGEDFQEDWDVEEPSGGDDVRNEEIPHLTDGDVKDSVDLQMDNSMDLFGDDEAFLQMTIPDISTPGASPKTYPSTSNVANSTKKMSNILHTPTIPHNITHTTEHMHRSSHTGDSTLTKPVTHTPCDQLKPQKIMAETAHDTHTTAANKHVPAHTSLKSFDSSHDYFSVNFDLGYSLEDSEEEQEEEADPSTSISPLPKKQAVADSSTPYNGIPRARMPLLSSESKLSTPQMLSERRRRETNSVLASPLTSKGSALPSPIASPGTRWMNSPGPVGLQTPSMLSSLMRRRLDSPTSVGSGPRQGSDWTSDSPQHPGWFSHQEFSFVDLKFLVLFCPHAPDPYNVLFVSHLPSQWSPSVTVTMRLWFIKEDSRIRSTHCPPQKW